MTGLVVFASSALLAWAYVTEKGHSQWRVAAAALGAALLGEAVGVGLLASGAPDWLLKAITSGAVFAAAASLRGSGMCDMNRTAGVGRLEHVGVGPQLSTKEVTLGSRN